jgi:hypothetical protein
LKNSLQKHSKDCHATLTLLLIIMKTKGCNKLKISKLCMTFYNFEYNTLKKNAV